MSMVNIEWSEQLSVGVKSVDEDHRKLVTLVNELFSACFVGVGDEAVSAILTEVIDYTQYHFTHEEDFLREHASPALDTQIKEHRQLTQQVSAIAQQGVSAFSEDVLLFLRDWLTHHIMETDMASFSPYR